MWAPVEGRYGRTRDGQRVGPMERWSGHNTTWAWGLPGVPPLAYKVDGRYSLDGSDHPLDLVAEWVDDGPVRTVTRQEIVPGTYGLVTVHETFKPVVRTYVTMNARDPSPDELDAAARVLAQLAEALRNGQ